MKYWMSLAVLAFSLGGCNSLQSVDQVLNMKLDPALSKESQELLRSDVKRLESYGINAKPGSYYDKSFGGTSGSSLLQYLNDRVSYIVPQMDDLTSRLKLGWFPLPAQGGGSSDPASGDKRAVVMALNIGFALWMTNQSLDLPFNLRFTIGDTSVPLTSPRVGIVELGEGYTMKSTPHTQITTVVRTSTLIHEARHSDCTGGLEEADLKLIKAGELPEHHECGHMHIDCPEGSPLAGLAACDDLPWGAYSIEGVYSASLVKTCSNCSEDEKQQAMINALDSFSRVTVLDDMLAGKLGDPDMSSSSEIRKSDPAVMQLLNAIEMERASGNHQPATIWAQ